MGDRSYFNILKLNAGYGKRIILKNTNLNVINVHVGVSLSYNFNHEFGHLSGEKASNINNIGGYSAKQYAATTSHKLFPALYFGITKDVRIFRNLYFTLDYQYDQGLILNFSQKIEYYKDSNPSEVTTLYNHFRGTAHAFSVGLKFRFLSKKYR